MCGIIGYTGTENAVPILLNGLKTLEYRGYDSAGIAVQSKQDITIVKTKGRLARLEEKIKNFPKASGSCGIGHTRWATHGAPTEANAHPHYSGAVTLVHNGIIENYAQLAVMLKEKGFSFYSQTDTEVAAKLTDMYYREEKDPIKAIARLTQSVRGSYAFGIMFSDIPGAVFAVRQDSPLIAAACPHGFLFASDIPALLSHTNVCYRLPAGVIATLKGDGICFTDTDLQPVAIEPEKIALTVQQAQKDGFEHFMLKEIYEEPEAFEKTVKSRLQGEKTDFSIPRLNGITRENLSRIHIVACGTAMHAGLIGKNLIERIARIPVDVQLASEFRYCDPILEPSSIVVLISQSGETADTLAALRHAKKRGIYTLAIVNVVGSAIASEADGVLYTHAGPEIAVASTKAYTVQCAVLYVLALHLAVKLGQMSETDAFAFTEEMLNRVGKSIKAALKASDEIRETAQNYKDAENIFFIGRGIDYALCAEGSLKLKEISYIHCEAYAAGELKHGTISLIDDGVPVVAVMTVSSLAEKMISGIREVKSRGAKVLCICTEEIVKIYEIPCDDIITVSGTDEFFAPFPAATVLQLFAYHISNLRGLDVDKPRNLAKSVTVE